MLQEERATNSFLSVEGDRGEGDQEKGAGGVWGVGEERAGSRIPKVMEGRRNREKLCNIAQYQELLKNILQSKKCREVGANKQEPD